ncbi:DUF6807 family protein [Tautonia sociabilis]|uniref:Methane oxygenase PmoA n=1 Tax=Tautonia sociabilis TaxID=2080755 RepID=A0A432MK15_9BACT|nr:DUF6807 family protein [Tautonia sociabilis]RUL87741.1 hypothetical protein TsocGM_11200 [Tautonia sociabilis]
MRRLVVPLAIALAPVLLASPPSRAQSVPILVEAGDHDRSQTPVQAVLVLPEEFGRGTVALLASEGGRPIVGQLTAPSLLESSPGEVPRGHIIRELHFILPEMKAGESARFELSAPSVRASEMGGFSWRKSGQGDLLVKGDKPVLLYVRPTLDESSPEAREQTYKPFHHLFAPDGRLVTKGPGGLFTHHRGLFFGFNRVSYGDGKQADVWHARGKAYQSHEESVLEEAGPVVGRHRVRIDWHGQEGEVFAEETREVTAYAVAGKGFAIDFASRVETTAGPVRLDGDPQHAGVHFRASNQVADVTKDQTYYLRPDGKGQPGATRNWDPSTGEGPVNLPWNAMSFVLDGDRYTVAYLDRPDNPKEARYSERDYGRFGSYFEYELTAEHPLAVRYRLWLREGELTVEEAARLDADFDEPVQVRLLD